MEIQELNIENYINHLPNIRKDVDIDLEKVEKKWKKSGEIISMLMDREYKKMGIVPNETTDPISTELIDKIRKLFFQLFEEVRRLKTFKEWYNIKRIDIEYLLQGKEEKEFYLPNNEDVKTLEYLKNSILKTLEFDFIQVLNLCSPELKNKIIDKKIQNLDYHYYSNYESGEMIIQSSPNGTLEMINVANDWAKYDFIQYLKGEKLEESLSIENSDYDWSLPKRLQMLNEIGFFDLPIFKKGLSEFKQAKIVNIILGKDDGNTRKYLSSINGLVSNNVSNPLIHKELCKNKITELKIG
jgi:hypothetical protein